MPAALYEIATWCTPHLQPLFAHFSHAAHTQTTSRASAWAQVTHDVSHLTCADFLRAPGAQTPVAVRFSTVIHERGSPETLRDPRGFAVKFYTREGNYDMVGNNFPVFFVRDGMKFPDMVHALKPNPKNHIQVRFLLLLGLSPLGGVALLRGFLLEQHCAARGSGLASQSSCLAWGTEELELDLSRM